MFPLTTGNPAYFQPDNVDISRGAAKIQLFHTSISACE